MLKNSTLMSYMSYVEEYERSINESSMLYQGIIVVRAMYGFLKHVHTVIKIHFTTDINLLSKFCIAEKCSLKNLVWNFAFFIAKTAMDCGTCVAFS